jgi:hypothetical protein
MQAVDNKISIDGDARFMMSQEKNQSMVIDFFETLQDYGIKFSPNQRQMLVSDVNTLVLGRSGTGKTTISAFKILALDLLFMSYKKNFVHGEGTFKLTNKDFKDLCGCATVFSTASPVLTNEVKRFYCDLITSIKKVLKAREDKIAENKIKKQKQNEEVKESEKINENENLDDGNPFEEDREEQDKLKEGLFAALETTKQDILEDLETEKQMTHYNRLKLIPKAEYPLFLTVKKLIYMLDGDCSYSFFCRDINGKIYGMDSSNEWHNESKDGAFMINRYQRDPYDFDKTIKKIGKEMIAAEELSDPEKLLLLQNQGYNLTEEELENFTSLQKDIDSDDEETNEKINLKEFLRDQQTYVSASKLSIESQMFSQEIDFEIFEKKFWGKNKGSLRISALNVWNEIYSVIKGGLDAIINAKRYYNMGIVDKGTYTGMKSSMEDYITDRERHLVYLIYVKYEKWKNMHHYYDFMDVVRHVFKYYPYWSIKNKLDYLVVDEVQDLAPLTIQLLLLVTNEKVFFCGDTAQTIAKGVTFRFHDLKPVFVNQNEIMKDRKQMKNKKQPEDLYDGPLIVQLTKNYRSHRRILQLANSVVDLVELYFPKTIDKLQREDSELDGPTPIILSGFSGDDLQKMMMSVSKSKVPMFGCNQVVIVRDQETKKTIPLFLKKALCLTVYEAKGLEFDDVILYNFFTDSHTTSQHWRLINDVEVITGKHFILKSN